MNWSLCRGNCRGWMPSSFGQWGMISLVGLLIIVCGPQPAGNAPKHNGRTGSTPGEVVREAMTAANGGRYHRVEELSARQLREAIRTGVYAGLGGTKGVWDWCTRGRAMTDLQILDEEISGDTAGVVIARFIRDERKPRLLFFRLVREENHWKIADFGEEGRFRQLLRYLW